MWAFHIGGYQVCEKWLKDRKGRPLSKADITHYQKIVVALSETIRLMKEIDEVIDQHGGWPFPANGFARAAVRRMFEKLTGYSPVSGLGRALSGSRKLLSVTYSREVPR